VGEPAADLRDIEDEVHGIKNLDAIKKGQTIRATGAARGQEHNAVTISRM
jgi:hypothetical protein